jgi:anti-sigma B factor antagonist
MARVHWSACFAMGVLDLAAEDGIVWYLRVAEEDLGPILVLVAEGRVSEATAGDLGRALGRDDIDRRTGIIIDFSGVDYINSAGLLVLESAAARLQGSHCGLVVCSLQPVVRATFELAGSVAHLATEPSREAAIARLRGRARFPRSAHG